MKKLILLFLLAFPLMVNAQWRITKTGELVDSVTGKPYMIIEKEGSASNLYKSVLKNVHKIFISPDDVVSTIEDEMISVRGWGKTKVKYGFIEGTFEPLIAVKVEFKDNRMRISASWIDTKWMGNNRTDPYTLLAEGGLRCFNKKGEIKNEKRFLAFNKVSSDFINRLIEGDPEESW